MVDIESINNVIISETGFWTSPLTVGHIFDQGLAYGISKLCSNLSTFWDIGCGNGYYVKYLNENGFNGNGIDGNPNTSDGNLILDLSKLINIPKRDFSISIEVGEHIPKEYENVFLMNLTNSSNYIILSWANKAQIGSGHVNPKNNIEVIKKMNQFNYSVDLEKSGFLRNCASQWYLKKTILVFNLS